MGSKIQMLTGRTAKYVEAMIREGDDFDYYRWLRGVQQEDARVKSVAVSTPVQPIVPRPETAQNPGEFKDPETADTAKHKSVVRRTIQQVGHCTKSIDKPKKSIRQNAWDDFQETRDRDAVYGYLRAVFSIVKHYNGRHRTKKLMRRAYKFAGVTVDTNADPFAAVIRCTCEHKLDNKTISKWSRALRYVARCAALFAESLGRGKR